MLKTCPQLKFYRLISFNSFLVSDWYFSHQLILAFQHLCEPFLSMEEKLHESPGLHRGAPVRGWVRMREKEFTMRFWVYCGFICLLITGSSALADGDWADRISIKGDIRLRYEYIDVDDMRKDRHRGRFRARLGLSGEITETVSAHFRLASGGDDPVSTNQTFDDGFSTKDFGLDRAYVDWAIQDGLNLWGGKMKQPFYKVGQLVWDNDLNPEGGALKYETAMTDVIDFHANGSIWVADERSADSDTTMWGIQAGADGDLSETVSVGGGVGYYFWDNMKGFETLFDPADGFGNTVSTSDADGTTTYMNDYEILDLYLKLSMVPDKIAVPVQVYGNYIVNTAADTSGDTAYMVGFQIGVAKGPGTWSVDYNYRDVEADATVGVLTDSDSFGAGTNGDGHRIEGRYAITEKIQSALALYLQKLDPDATNIDYTRLQADISVRF